MLYNSLVNQSLANLILSAMSDGTAASAPRGSAGVPSEEGGFASLLSGAMDRTGSASACAGEQSAQSTLAASIPPGLVGVLSALLGGNMEAFLQALSPAEPDAQQAGSASQSTAQTVGSSAKAGTRSENGAKPATGKATGEDLAGVLAGLLTLIVRKGGNSADGADVRSLSPESDAGSSDGGTTGGAPGEGPATVPAASRQADGSGEGKKSTGGTDEEEQLRQALALFLFTGIEAAGAAGVSSGAVGARQASPGAGTGAQQAAARTQQATVPQAAGQESPQGANAGLAASDPGGDNARGFPLTQKGSASERQEGGAAVEALLSPGTADGASEDGNSLTVTIKHLGQPAGQTGQAYGTAAGAKGAQGEPPPGHDWQTGSREVVTVVREIRSLAGGDTNAGGDAGSGGNSPAGKEHAPSGGAYPFPFDRDVPAADQAGPEQASAGQPVQADTMERFDRVVEQLQARTGSHDLTVRVAMGSEESLVVGLKDLGRTVTVDVKASSQGMINLLQSERDTDRQAPGGQGYTHEHFYRPERVGDPGEERQERDATGLHITQAGRRGVRRLSRDIRLKEVQYGYKRGKQRYLGFFLDSDDVGDHLYEQ